MRSKKKDFVYRELLQIVHTDMVAMVSGSQVFSRGADSQKIHAAVWCWEGKRQYMDLYSYSMYRKVTYMHANQLRVKTTEFINRGIVIPLYSAHNDIHAACTVKVLIEATGTIRMSVSIFIQIIQKSLCGTFTVCRTSGNFLF